MQRVLIIGPCGAGKSTLARPVAERKSLPLHHLDAMFWSAGWVMRERGEFIALLENALKGDAWVIEGTYVSSLTQRMVRADQLIYLDFPTWLCLWRLLKRLLNVWRVWFM